MSRETERQIAGLTLEQAAECLGISLSTPAVGPTR
jgi:hypothetical protein